MISNIRDSNIVGYPKTFNIQDFDSKSESDRIVRLDSISRFRRVYGQFETCGGAEEVYLVSAKDFSEQSRKTLNIR